MNGLAQAAAPPITGPALDNKRVAAAVIDLGVLFLVGFLLGALAGGFTFAAVAVSIAWGLYYYFALECLTGQTLGKKLMGLRVAQPDGGPPEMRQVGVRTGLRLVDGLGLYLVGLIVMLATGQRRQRLGDLAAGTVVTTVEEHDPAVAEESFDEEAARVLELHASRRESAPAAPAPAPPAEQPAFEHYKVPEPAPKPVSAPEPVPAPVAVPPPAEPRIELVPDPPADGEKPRIEIVSPIDLVMGEDEPQADDEAPPPPQPA